MDDAEFEEFLAETEKELNLKESVKQTKDNSALVNDSRNHALSDLLSLTEVVTTENIIEKAHSKGFKSELPVKETNRKCHPLVLTGSEMARGLSNTNDQRACNNMMCIGCDFKVVSFDNFKWHKETDYLHLRNNMPDFHRLKSRLTEKKGSRAYACQCQHKSVESVQEVKAELKWVCMRHQ